MYKGEISDYTAALNMYKGEISDYTAALNMYMYMYLWNLKCNPNTIINGNFLFRKWELSNI